MISAAGVIQIDVPEEICPAGMLMNTLVSRWKGRKAECQLSEN
jgi:hypothetical protein